MHLLRLYRRTQGYSRVIPWRFFAVGDNLVAAKLIKYCVHVGLQYD